MKYLTIPALILLAILALAAVFLYKDDLPKELVDASYSSEASQFMDLGDLGRVHFRDQGKRQGQTLLLLHGSNASLHTFEPWVALLREDYRLVSLDLPGHGLTGETPKADYSTDGFVQVVDELATRLNLDGFVLVGSSMGGGVALGYALAHPDKTQGLVLIGSGGLAVEEGVEAEDDTPHEPPIAFQLLAQPWFQAIAVKLDFRYLMGQGVRSAYNDSPMVNDELIRRYYELNLRSGTRAATIKRFQLGLPTRPEAEIASIQAPTLLVWGEEDALVPFAAALRFKELLPQAETAFYKDVGHMPMEEIPEKSAADLRQFLQAIAPAE
ncbi:MAG: alpha/beta fold hydrolase [Pseudomonadales bacterium]